MYVDKFKQQLDQNVDKFLLIGAHYPSKYEIAHLLGASLMPYPEIYTRKGIAQIKQMLENNRQGNPGHKAYLIVICKAGVFSHNSGTPLSK